MKDCDSMEIGNEWNGEMLPPGTVFARGHTLDFLERLVAAVLPAVIGQTVRRNYGGEDDERLTLHLQSPDKVADITMAYVEAMMSRTAKWIAKATS